MTETDWLVSDNPTGMLGFLGARATARKLRLFACSCCRLVWAALTDSRSRAAVEMAERGADGLAAEEELPGAYELAAEAAAAFPRESKERARAEAAEGTVRQWRPRIAAMVAAPQAAWVRNTAPRGRAGQLGRAERRRLGAVCAGLVRDIFGNPFRAAPAMEPSLLLWNGGAVVQLARAAYELRILPDGHLDPARLAVLADALEEAGAQEELLAHLRARGPHVRGCWCLDILMDRS